jgi:A/G-specific adenine glycosylase
MKSSRTNKVQASTPSSLSPQYSDPDFSSAVIAWQKQHGRHALPWQNTRDAYRVWLSEIMLQQTQVSAVIPYYEKFLHSFPTVQALAGAPSEAVMAHWSGLGYYTRARNLHACAKIVASDYDGKFPADPALLIQLPGIGRSTAAAISAFSYGTIAAILDGNVKRVFARVFGIDGYPGAKPIEDAMWLRAHALLPERDIESYTQGLMDLGATLCTRSTPSCPRCPLVQRCVAYAGQRTQELPVRKPKKIQREKRALMPIILFAQQVLLEQRANSGIWGGLLSLPELDGMTESVRLGLLAPADNVVSDVQQRIQGFSEQFGAVSVITPVPLLRHSFTHFNLSIHAYAVQLAQRQTQVAEPRYVWLDLATIGNAPLPAPIKTILLSLSKV